LTFIKGAVIAVTRQLEGGWWEGTLNNKTGWFPSNYVRPFEEDRKPRRSKEELILEYYKQVLDELLESEKKHVEQMELFLDKYMQPLEGMDVVSTGEARTLCGNLTDVITFQKTFLNDLQSLDRLAHSKQMVGAIFLHHLSQFQETYETYCSNHPWAVAVMTDNQDKLNAYMEDRGAASPGLLCLSMNLSQPFRRLDRYPSTLLELQRQIKDKHQDRGNLEKAVQAYSDLKERTQLIRKRKELEYDMVTGSVEGNEGQSLEDYGKCIIMIPATEHLPDGGYDDRFILLFPELIVILSVSQTLSGYHLEHKFSMFDAVMKIAHDISLNTVNITVHNHSVKLTCASQADRDQLLAKWDMTAKSNASSVVMRRHSTALSRQKIGSIFSKASSSTGLNAAAAKLFNKKQSGSQLSSFKAQSVQISRPTHWSFRSLRPMPPLKANVVYKNEESTRSPKLGRRTFSAVSKKFSRNRKEDLTKKLSEASLQDDDSILKVIEAYCYSARLKTIASYTCLEEEDVVTPSPDRDSITLHYTYDQEDIPVSLQL
jgi:Rho guanine nucleotide exchange factor 7